jgi:hypothetical protein
MDIDLNKFPNESLHLNDRWRWGFDLIVLLIPLLILQISKHHTCVFKCSQNIFFCLYHLNLHSLADHSLLFRSKLCIKWCSFSSSLDSNVSNLSLFFLSPVMKDNYLFLFMRVYSLIYLYLSSFVNMLLWWLLSNLSNKSKPPAPVF